MDQWRGMRRVGEGGSSPRALPLSCLSRLGDLTKPRLRTLDNHPRWHLASARGWHEDLCLQPKLTFQPFTQTHISFHTQKTFGYTRNTPKRLNWIRGAPAGVRTGRRPVGRRGARGRARPCAAPTARNARTCNESRGTRCPPGGVLLASFARITMLSCRDV